MLTKRRELINVHADVCWWCLLNSSVERLVAQSHITGVAWQNQTEVMSEMNSSDVSVAGGVGGFKFLWLDFQAEASVKRWWMRLQSVWLTSHECLHHHSLDNSSSCFPPKKKKKKSKGNVWVMRRYDKRIYGCLCSGGRMNSSVGVFVFRRQ